MSELKTVSILLESCNFCMNENKADEDKKYSLFLEKYEPQETSSDAKFTYSALLSFDLMHDVDHPSMEMHCSFRLIYEGDKDCREKLKEHIVVAHAVTYLREFVSNITMRTKMPTLIIDPVNAFELWKKYSGQTQA